MLFLRTRPGVYYRLDVGLGAEDSLRVRKRKQHSDGLRQRQSVGLQYDRAA